MAEYSGKQEVGKLVKFKCKTVNTGDPLRRYPNVPRYVMKEVRRPDGKPLKSKDLKVGEEYSICVKCGELMTIEEVSCGFPTHENQEERFEEMYVCKCGNQISINE